MKNAIIITALILVVAGCTNQQTQTQDNSVEKPQTMDGKVLIDEYSDFKCSYCARAAPTVHQIMDEYEGVVEVRFKHFPLAFHRGADKAAQAAECARDQGMFWEYHDSLFAKLKNGVDTGTDKAMTDTAAELGLDMQAFNPCLSSGEKKQIVDDHIEEGKRLGVTGTPTFFVDGQKIVGAQSYKVFKQIIESKR